MYTWLSFTVLSMLAMSSLFHFSSKVQSDPQSVFEAFLDAEISHDLISLLKYSKDDTSVENNVSNQIALLSRGNKSNTIVDYEILSKKQIDPTHVEFTYRIKEAGGQLIPPLPMTVVQQKGKWIVNFQLVEVNGMKNSPDFGKVTKIESKEVILSYGVFAKE